ncbi:MAG: hypothetical protein IPN26_12170 [Bacteroidetes bacterium]|nr:hypothetical protein [Bacteroidota bacterium]
MKDKSEQDLEFQAITKNRFLLNNRISENVKSVEEKLKESKSIIAEFEKEKVDATNEIEKLKREVIELTRQNTEFIIRLNKKEDLLVTFRKEIKSVLEKNESYRETTENRNEEIRNNSINNLNQENAETLLNFKKRGWKNK